MRVHYRRSQSVLSSTVDSGEVAAHSDADDTISADSDVEIEILGGEEPPDEWLGLSMKEEQNVGSEAEILTEDSWRLVERDDSDMEVRGLQCYTIPTLWCKPWAILQASRRLSDVLDVIQEYLTSSSGLE